MKLGFRTPSISRSIKSRTSGRVTRSVKSSVNPLYGNKGMGLVNDPGKAVYNKVYSKTSRPIIDYSHAFDSTSHNKQPPHNMSAITSNLPYIICPRCGIRYDRRRSVCPKCGLLRQNSPLPKQKKKMALWKKICLFFVGLVIVSGIVSELFPSSKNKSSIQEDSSNADKVRVTTVQEEKVETTSSSSSLQMNDLFDVTASDTGTIDVIALNPPSDEVTASQAEVIPEESIPEVVVYNPAPVQDDDMSSIVYVTSSGSKFHREWCQHIKGKNNLRSMTKAEALALHLEACKDCSP